MLTMAVITLVGCGVAIVAILVVHHRTSALCQAAKTGTDQEMHEMVSRAKALDIKLAEEVLGGNDVDHAIEDFARARTGILSITGTDAPWLWDADDVKKWGEKELGIQVAAHNRKGRLAALSTPDEVQRAVEEAGFEVRRTFKNADAWIATEAFALANKADVIAFIGGDGDLEPVAILLKAFGVRVEVWSWSDKISPRLRQHADVFVPLSRDLLR